MSFCVAVCFIPDQLKYYQQTLFTFIYPKYHNKLFVP